jgi:hypothetical protein
MISDTDDCILKHIKHPNPTLCSIALRQNKKNINYIPFEMIMDRLTWIHIDEPILKYADLSDIATPKVCEIALNHDANNIKYIPQDMLSQDMIWIYISRYDHNIDDIPQDRLTKEMLWYIVEEFPLTAMKLQLTREMREYIGLVFR